MIKKSVGRTIGADKRSELADDSDERLVDILARPADNLHRR
jgi:hypothetical protein